MAGSPARGPDLIRSLGHTLMRADWSAHTNLPRLPISRLFHAPSRTSLHARAGGEMRASL